jgi:dipeptidyl aminopeptidase/acylaminoacyl peptidase
VSEPILRLGGYRINPRSNGPIEARAQWLNSLAFEDVATGKVTTVALPHGARFMDQRWSAEGQKLAFVLDGKQGLELWVADRKTATAHKIEGVRVNAAFGASYDWLPGGQGLLVSTVPAGRGSAPAADDTPTGPIIQQSGGRTAAIRTYQDLLASEHDEALFDYYFTSPAGPREPGRRRPGAGGRARDLSERHAVAGRPVHPDHQAQAPLQLSGPRRPFPNRDQRALGRRQAGQGRDRPSAGRQPARSLRLGVGRAALGLWRSDVPATLVWAEAQDGGDPKKKVAVHDRVLTLAAPFAAAPTTLADIGERYAGIDWGRDDFALLTTRWFETRKEKRVALDPSKPGTSRLILERNYQDKYNDPGSAVSRVNARGEEVLHFTPDGKGVFVTGAGATAKGEFPFVGVLNLADGKTTRQWQSAAPYYEAPVALADDAGKTVITRRESKDDAPNYFIRAVKGGKSKALTSFPDRAPQFAGVTKQTITYSRPDGVKLSGTLYLPAGYDKAKQGPLPMLMWAYPEEFTDASVASQTVDSGNRFTRPGGISPLFLLTQGYAVLDGPSMPIIGVNGAEPNDTYIEQLTADAKAAVDAVVAMGVADRDKIAVGGHSYGAFMTANLLAHTDLFRTGIARSGAYNRTLTPFGFQSEHAPTGRRPTPIRR